MSLSLEVKKFVNSESIGEFVTVLLPGEIPTANEELRARSRERAAAEKAERHAAALAEDERLASAEADEAAQALSEGKAALAEQDKALEQQKKERSALNSELDKKKAALDRAVKELEKAAAENKKKASALEAAQALFSAAETAKKEAEARLAALKKSGERAEEKSGEAKTEEKAEKKPEEKSGGVKLGEAKPEEKSEEAKTEGVKPKDAKLEEKSEEAKTEAKTEKKSEVVKPEDDSADSTEVKAEEKTEEAKPEEKSEEAKAEEKPLITAEEAEKALEKAKAELEKAKAELEKAKAGLDEAEKAAASSGETEKKRLAEKEKLEGEHTLLRGLFDAGSGEIERFKAERSEVNERFKALEKASGEAKSRLAEAKRAHEDAVKEAARLRSAVRVLKTEHESARMHYLESGKGEALILIHTAGQSLFTFRSIFHKLAMVYHVYAVDLMGHGYSERPEFFDHSSASHAESIIAFMDALGIERAHLVGFSMGALYALEAARRYPEQVMSVTALSPGGVTSSMPLAVRMMESALFGGIASRLFRVRTVEKLLDDCLFDHTVIGPHEVEQYYKCACDQEARRAIKLTVSSAGEKELMETLSEIKTPVLVVSSDKDRWHSLEHGEAYANAIENAQFVRVRNAGHLLHEEKPDRLVEIVRAFIPAGYGDYDGREA